MIGFANACLVNFPTSDIEEHTAVSLSFFTGKNCICETYQFLSLKPLSAVSQVVDDTVPHSVSFVLN